MSLTEEKMRKVTFSDGLPRGTCATFTHDGELWFAYPQQKARAMTAATDLLLGTVMALHEDLLTWVNTHPEDAARAMQMMARTLRAQELAREKIQAWTM